MAKTPSSMLPLGTPAPAFSLPDPQGKIHALEQVAGPKGVLVMFICNHCPYVVHVAGELARLGRDLPASGVGVVAINSNDVTSHPDDRPEKMAEESRKRGYAFPYLYDESQAVAQAYQAACTPDFFLFDADRRLVYRGQLDTSRPGNATPVTGESLRAAVAALVGGQTVASEQRPSLGCNIKWRQGNEPSYYP